MSHPDLFHLSLWLSPPPIFIIISSCTYACILGLSVASSSCLVKLTSMFFRAPAFLVSVFLVLLVLTHSACSDTGPACLTIPPALTSIPACPHCTFRALTWLKLMNFSLSLTCPLPVPCISINIRDSNHLPPVSASGSCPVSLYLQCSL